jgi:hypothetical protein
MVSKRYLSVGLAKPIKLVQIFLLKLFDMQSLINGNPLRPVWVFKFTSINTCNAADTLHVGYEDGQSPAPDRSEGLLRVS